MEPAGEFRTATASHSHLFPGAVILIDPKDSEEDLGSDPLGLTVVFSDGSSSHAELVVGVDAEETDEAALIVDGYSTAAGAAIARRMWRIAERVLDDGAWRIRIGRRLPYD